MVSPAGASPSLSYPGGWHTTARPRGKRGSTNERAREEGRGRVRSRARGVAFLRSADPRRGGDVGVRRSRAIEARAGWRRARSRRETHSNRTPGGGAGGCTSRHREAPSLRISRRREWRKERRSRRAPFFSRTARPRVRGSRPPPRQIRMKFFCETSDRRREARGSSFVRHKRALIVLKVTTHVRRARVVVSIRVARSGHDSRHRR